MLDRRRLALLISVSFVSALPWGTASAQPEPFDFVRPTLDIVRADTMGGLIVAGVAGPGVAVEFLAGTIVVARALANVEGAWAAVIGTGLSAGRHDLMLRITTADGRFQVLTDDRLPVEIVEEGRRRTVAWLGPPLPAGPATSTPPVIVEGEGNIALVGATAPDRRVTITFDGRELAGDADAVGAWRIELGGRLAIGDHALTIVERDAAGTVVAEADLTLTVGPAGGVELAVDLTPVPPMVAAAETPRTAVVGPNDTLWDLAVRFYGDGTRYFDIYAANRREIGGNPRAIYPGQVLLIP